MYRNDLSPRLDLSRLGHGARGDIRIFRIRGTVIINNLAIFIDLISTDFSHAGVDIWRRIIAIDGAAVDSTSFVETILVKIDTG